MLGEVVQVVGVEEESPNNLNGGGVGMVERAAPPGRGGSGGIGGMSTGLAVHQVRTALAATVVRAEMVTMLLRNTRISLQEPPVVAKWWRGCRLR